MCFRLYVDRISIAFVCQLALSQAILWLRRFSELIHVMIVFYRSSEFEFVLLTQNSDVDVPLSSTVGVLKIEAHLHLPFFPEEC